MAALAALCWFQVVHAVLSRGDACWERGRKKEEEEKNEGREKFWAALAPTLAPHWGPQPVCFVPGYLALPSEGGEGVLGLWGPYRGHLGSLVPPLPHSCSGHSPPFKVQRCCAVRGLDVCLVPYMHSYHYPRLLTIAAPRLCYICSSLPRGRDTTLRLISPLLHSTPCLYAPRSYSSSSSPPHTPCTDSVWISHLKTWEIFYLSKWRWHLRPLPW